MLLPIYKSGLCPLRLPTHTDNHFVTRINFQWSTIAMTTILNELPVLHAKSVNDDTL
jgi:hypothetical protein